MHVTVATEARFSRGVDGVIRSDTGGRAYPFWSRYLVAFDSVTVLARVTDDGRGDGHQVTGQSVDVFPLPGYVGLRGALSVLPLALRRIRQVSRREDTAYIARVPGLIGGLLVRQLRLVGRPYALEVVGDPSEVLRTGLTHPSVAGMLGGVSSWIMRRECAAACAVSYVTRQQLQRLYPASQAAYSTYYSNVDLAEDAFTPEPPPTRMGRLLLVTVGTQSQLYKGHDVLISAVSLLRGNGFLVDLTLVGDGRYRPQLEALASTLNVADQVSFAGILPTGPAVRQVLDRADLFVLPSRTEGLPRALIEAMARGLPCIASRIGGIPELLPEEDMAPPGDATALAALIARVAKDPGRRGLMGMRNLALAHSYEDAILAKRRLSFYRAAGDAAAHSTGALEAKCA